jgi:hypothetical protein
MPRLPALIQILILILILISRLKPPCHLASKTISFSVRTG